MKRVTIFKSGSRKDGKVILVKDSIEKLVQDVCEKFKLTEHSLEQVQFYTSSGAMSDDVQVMKDDEVLFVSVDAQSLVPPPSELPKPPREWITLNVGGKKFTTTRSTLTKSQPDSMLARMFSNDSDGMTPSPVDESGAFLIDRSPVYFEPIIGYLRHGQLVVDDNVNIRGVLEEARFFGLETLVKVIEEQIEQEVKIESRSMCLNRKDVINALIGTTCNAELRFQGVNLSGSDLSKLDLRNINFKYANFKAANLSGANLSYCCLERADMSECNLDGAILHGVKMVCANLEGSSLKGINCEDPLSRVTNMEGINLKGANLDGSQLAGVNLRVATLKNAFLSNCDLRRAVLAGADLENCDLSGSDLHEANLRGANLKDAAFELMMTPLHMAQAIGR